MTWSFNLNLDGKPLVLAGPILRRVTQLDATVWLALKKPAKVTLAIKDAQGDVFTGSRQTCAVGKNLHIVAVTASHLAPGRGPGTLLVPGVIYSYVLTFEVAGQAPLDLAGATGKADLTYATYATPTFCMPPKDPNKLRLIHGSCRHPNGINGKDALSLLDGLIAEVAQDPDKRPHQLFLSGDQIYADDVSGALLMLLSSASDQLLGWQEILPIANPDLSGKPRPGSQVPPYFRRRISKDIGLTSDQSDNHLFTLGEYLSMYLFVWSDELWKASDLPAMADVLAAYMSQHQGGTDIFTSQLTQLEILRLRDKVDENTKYVKTFRATLGQVRKALANIPTYMILDDHEITDDFHLDRDFCEAVYGNAMGLRVMQNGLVAYALCQHWGNDPAAFEDNAVTNPPGRRLLGMLDKGSAPTYETQATNIAGVVGVHPASALKTPPSSAVSADRANVFAVFHDPDGLTWNYSVDFPSHQVIVTDSRTWRSFPYGKGEAGELIPKDQIRKQVANVTPATGDKPLFVVLTTNAPPVRIIRFGERHPWLATAKTAVLDNDPHPDLWDSWELPSPALDRLFVALSDRVPLGADKVRRGSAILLSGDVHSSFATRLVYNGAQRYEDKTPQPVNMVIAQLVSSSLRNQASDTLGQHKTGYGYRVVGDTTPQGYIGWNVPAGSTKIVTGLPALILTGPATAGEVELDSGAQVIVPPDYGYRLDYISAVQERAIPDFAKHPLPPPSDPQNTAERFGKITANYRDYIASDTTKREIVGVTNLSEVTLTWDQTDPTKRWVSQTVRWFSGKSVRLTRYLISLNPNDPGYRLKDALKTVGLTQPVAWAP